MNRPTANVARGQKQEKVVITLTETEGEINISVKMDPPLKSIDEPTNLQLLAIVMSQKAKEFLEEEV